MVTEYIKKFSYGKLAIKLSTLSILAFITFSTASTREMSIGQQVSGACVSFFVGCNSCTQSNKLGEYMK